MNGNKYFFSSSSFLALKGEYILNLDTETTESALESLLSKFIASSINFEVTVGALQNKRTTK